MNSNKTLITVLRYSILALLAATLFVPLIVSNSMFFPFIVGKAYTFRILVEVAFGAWIILALFDKNARPRISPLSIGITLFTIMALIADLSGINPIRSLWSNFERSEGWITIIHLWAYFMVLASVFRTRIAWHRFFNVSFVAAVIVAFWAVLQFFHAASNHGDGTRLDASLGNAEYLAVYMLINAFLALYMSVVAWSKKEAQGWLYLGLFVFFNLIVFGTQTRGTILALVGASLVILAIVAIVKDKHLPADRQKANGVIRIVAASIIVAIVLVSGLFYHYRNSHFIQSHGLTQRIASISLDNPRLEYIWPMAWKGFKEKPLLGWGQENFNYVFNDFYNPKMWSQEQWFDRAHNVFIDWAIAGGVFGLLFYAALYVLSLVAVWKSRFSVMERAVLTGLIVGYAIHNMFVFDNLASYIMFFITLGFLHLSSVEAAGDAAKPGKLAKISDKIAAVAVNPEVTEWIVAPVLVILVVGVAYFFNYRPISANLDLIQGMTYCQSPGGQNAPTPTVVPFVNALNVNAYVANQEVREQLDSCAAQVISAQGIGNDVKLAFYQATSAAIDAQAKATPYDLRGFIFGASFFDGIGEYDAATKYAERAYELSPVKQSVLLELASNRMSMGSTTEALALLKTAYTEAPDYTSAKIAYARGLYLSGDYKTAISMFKEIIAADPSNVQNHVTLAVIYMAEKDTKDAIAELNVIAGLDPSYAAPAAAAIKEIQAGKNPFQSAPAGTVAAS